MVDTGLSKPQQNPEAATDFTQFLRSLKQPSIGADEDKYGWFAGPFYFFGQKLLQWLQIANRAGVDGIDASYEELLLELGVPKDSLKDVEKLLQQIRTLPPGINLVLSVITVAALTLGSTEPIISSIIKLTEPGVLKLLTPNRLDVESYMRYLFRGDKKLAEVIDALKNWGYDADRAEEFINSNWEILPTNDALNLLRTGTADVEQVKKLLKNNGWIDPNQQHNLIKSSVIPFNKHAITDVPIYGGNLKGLSNIGNSSVSIPAATLKQLESGKLNNLELEQILELLNRGYYSDYLVGVRNNKGITLPDFTSLPQYSDLINYIKALGYTDQEIGSFKNLIAERTSLADSILLWRKNELDDSALAQRFVQLGYTENVAAQMMQLRYEEATPSDLVSFGIRDAFYPKVVERFQYSAENPRIDTSLGGDTVTKFNQFLRRSGLRPEAWDAQWRSHWHQPSRTEAADMLHRGLITSDDFKLLLKAQDIPPFWRDKLTTLTTPLIPLYLLWSKLNSGDIPKKQGVELLALLGYNEATITLILDSVAAANTTKVKELTQSQIEAAYKEGVYDRSTALAQLETLNYPINIAETLIALWDVDIKKSAGIVTLTADESAQRSSLDALKRIIVKGIYDDRYSEKQARTSLLGLGYSSDTVNAIVSEAVLQRSLNEKSTVETTTKTGYVEGYISEAQARKQMYAVGFVPSEVSRLITTWKPEYNLNQQKKNARTRIPTPSELDKYLEENIIDTQTWREYYAKNGYTDESILFRLLYLAKTKGVKINVSKK